MSKDLIVDRKYLSYVKALNFYDGKTFMDLKRGTTLEIGDFSNLRDLNLFCVLLLRKFLTKDENSFSLNLNKFTPITISSFFNESINNGFEEKALVVRYNNHQLGSDDPVNLYNSSFFVKYTGSYFPYLLDVSDINDTDSIYYNCFVTNTDEIFTNFFGRHMDLESIGVKVINCF